MEKETFDKARVDCINLVEPLEKRGVKLAGFDGQGLPEFSESAVSFNGWGITGYETFCIERLYDTDRDLHPDDPLKYAFCKTERKPYDLAVSACLLVFKHHFGDRFKLISDDGSDGFRAGADLVQEVLGYKMDVEKEVAVG